MIRGESASGFSLVETLVATALLATAVAALGQLFAVAIINTSAARSATYAAMAAAAKVEELRGIPLTAAALAPTASGTLRENTPGSVDYLDDRGRVIDAAGSGLPAGTAFIRRWSITPLPANPANAIVLQVVVLPRDRHGEVHLVSVRARPSG